jgi:crossover junction endodeoxyribonuclease RusA
MSEPISFFVPGLCATKGSWRPITSKTTGKVFLVDSCKRSRPWAALIADAAREAGATVSRDAVALDRTFWLQRPKSHYGAKGLRPSAPLFPTHKPDVDKLDRCLFDALTGVAYADDAQVIGGVQYKLFADEGHPPGLSVTLREPKGD